MTELTNEMDAHGAQSGDSMSTVGAPAPLPSSDEANACLANRQCQSTPGDDTKHVVTISPCFPVKQRKQILNLVTGDKCESWQSGGGVFGSHRNHHDKSGKSVGVRAHAGCDIYVMAAGESVYAVKSGEIVGCITQPAGGWGGTQWIAVDHGDFIARYCEISNLAKTSGKVYQGEFLGKVKTTTYAIKQPMLHFEIFSKLAAGGFDVDFNSSLVVNGNRTGRRSDLVNPAPYLEKWLDNLPQGN
jgi:murein DD-endopeptidase MepM/ murein hydrolase activator NlpD